MGERKILECIYGLEYGREMKIKELTTLLSEENMSNVKLLLSKAIHLLKGNEVGLINFIQEEIQNPRSESRNVLLNSSSEDSRRNIDTPNNPENPSLFQAETEKIKKRLQIEDMLNKERDAALGQRRKDLTQVEGGNITKRKVQKNASSKMKTNFQSETCKKHVCEHCNKSFATRQTMLHHVKYNKKCLASRKM